MQVLVDKSKKRKASEVASCFSAAPAGFKFVFA